MKIRGLLFVYVLFLIETAVKGILFWRPYLGYTPSDAVVPGDIIARSVGLINDRYGVASGNLHNRYSYLDVIIGQNAIRTYDGIEVLCATSPNDYQWITVNTSSFLNLMEIYAPVIGGIENSISNNNLINTYIGKAQRIGKVLPTDYTLYYSHNLKTHTDTKFDILVYNNN